MPLAEAVLQRDVDTKTRSSNEPMPDIGMDTHSIVTSEQCERRITYVAKELGYMDPKNLVEQSTWCGLAPGCVIDATTMNLSDQLVHT